MQTLSWRQRGAANRGRVAAVLLVASLTLMPEPGQAVRAVGQTFRSAIDLIAVDVQVIDRQGNPVEALSPDRFVHD